MGCLREAFLGHAAQQRLKRRDVAHHQVMQKSKVALIDVALEIYLQGIDALTKTRSGGRKTRLKHRLELLEAGISEVLCKPHENGRMCPAFGRDRVDRLKRHHVGVLCEKPRYLLIPLRQNPNVVALESINAIAAKCGEIGRAHV